MSRVPSHHLTRGVAGRIGHGSRHSINPVGALAEVARNLPSRWNFWGMSCPGSQGPCIALTLREGRRAACSTAVYSVPTSAAAEADSSAFFAKFIREPNKLSERMEKQEARGSQRRRRGRGHTRCHRCQQPGHIARYCRAPAPIPGGDANPQ